MSSTTPNFNLKQDAGSDNIGQTISDLSANISIIDSEIQNRKNDLTTHKTATVLDHPDGSVTKAKLALKAVGTPQLDDQAVTLPKIDPTLLTNVAGNQNNVFAPNSYSWVATANQQTFTLPANTMYTVGFIWVNVGGIDQTKDAFTATDGVSFTVAEPLTAGTKVDARWFQGQLVSQAHHTSHYANGADAIDVTQLQNYSSAVDSRIVTNTNQIGTLANISAYCDFSTKTNNSSISTLDSNQPTVNFGVAPMTISNGQLVHTPYTGGTESAGYLQIQLPSRITLLGGEFIIPIGANGAQFVLATPGEDWSSVSGFPDAGVHAWVTKTGWVFGIRQASVDTILAKAPFKTSLNDDGTTKYKFEIVINYKTSTATLHLPDGSIVTVTDSRIASLSSTYALWELYEQNPSPQTSTLTPLQISSVWASHQNVDVKYNQNATSRYELLNESNKVLKSVPLLVSPQVMVYQPSTEADWTAPTSLANVDATNAKISVTVPQSGKMLVEVLGHMVNSMAGSAYLLALDSGGNGSGGNAQQVTNGTYNGNFSASWLLTGMTQQSGTVDIKLSHFATSAGPVLKAGSGSGYFLVMKATPIP